jgi:hypothetical protein
MKKKAQVQSQVFIYVLVLIVISFTIVFGYRAIKGLSRQSDDAIMVIFEEDLRNNINANMNYGSRNFFQLDLPKKYERICFVDLSEGTDAVPPEEYPLIYSSVSSGSTDNVFIGEGLERTLEIERLEVEDGFLCIENVVGVIKLQVDGLGDRAKISPIE